MTSPRKKIKLTINFEFLLDNFDKCRGIVLPGGTRSAKTISVCQFLVHYCRSNTGKKIIIARDTLATLKKTTLSDFEAVCYGRKGCDAMFPELKVRDKSGSPYCYINGNLIEFTGLNDDPMRVHGMDCDIFYINEAVGCYAKSFKQLAQRCNIGWILDCNPSEPNSWVYKLEKRADVMFHRTTYRDNPFLPLVMIKDIESYEPTHPEDRYLKLKDRRPHPTNIEEETADEKYWSIYGLGLVHKGKEIIYPDWDMYKDEPDGYDYCLYGIDWGWNHPFAFIQVTVEGNNMYLREMLYGSHIEQQDYEEVVCATPLLAQQKTYVVCDNSEPKSIRALQRKSIPAVKVKKPPGSIIDGIKKINSYNLFIHEDSINLQDEANNYKYKVDPHTEEVLDIAVDKHNDGFDAIRYVGLKFL